MTDKAEIGGAAAGTDAQHINITVKDQGGLSMEFRIKRSTLLKNVKDEYCLTQGLTANQCRFIFDGEYLNEGDTPDKLEMENGDSISVMIEQTGGGNGV